MNHTWLVTFGILICVLCSVIMHTTPCMKPSIYDTMLTPDQCQRVIEAAQRLGLNRSTVAEKTGNTISLFFHYNTHYTYTIHRGVLYMYDELHHTYRVCMM